MIDQLSMRGFEEYLSNNYRMTQSQYFPPHQLATLNLGAMEIINTQSSSSLKLPTLFLKQLILQVGHFGDA